MLGRVPWNKGKTGVYAKEVRLNMGAGHRGKKLSDAHIRKLRKARAKQIITDTHKKNQRLAAIKRIKRTRGQLKPNYNPDACKIIEEYGRKHGYNFQHAENGGEFYVGGLGFWVDGYDVKQNVVIEYDESYHYQNGKLREKDVQRQKEIQECLECKFIRLRADIHLQR